MRAGEYAHGRTGLSRVKVVPSRVAIVGLGLMGGSLALALSRRGVAVTGVEPDEGARSVLSSRLGPQDRLDAHAGTALGECPLAVFAVPPQALETAVRSVRPHLAAGAIVTDLTSLKAWPLAVMTRLLPGVRVVGGHPMAGRERGGAKAADADLFRDRPWAVVAGPTADDAAVAAVRALAVAVGATPVAVDAQAHDRAVAAVSHLPYLISGALARAVEALARSGLPVSELAGPGLDSMLRLAAQPAWMDEVAAKNAGDVRCALEAFDEALDATRQALQMAAVGDGDERTARLVRLGDEGREGRQRLLCAQPDGAPGAR